MTCDTLPAGDDLPPRDLAAVAAAELPNDPLRALILAELDDLAQSVGWARTLTADADGDRRSLTLVLGALAVVGEQMDVITSRLEDLAGLSDHV